MQKVYLNGEISKFGAYYETNCDTTIDVFKLLACQLSGFRKYLIDAAEAGIGFEVLRGDKVLTEGDHLLLSLAEEDLVITEVPTGSGGGVKILAAVAIVAFLVSNPAGWGTMVAATGQAGSLLGAGAFASGTFGAFAVNMALSVAVSLAISGITELLTSTPKIQGVDNLAQESSYLFNGPTNNMKYGQAIPIAYGELLIGGAPINNYYLKDPLV